jgi:hypothetical protein
MEELLFAVVIHIEREIANIFGFGEKYKGCYCKDDFLELFVV